MQLLVVRGDSSYIVSSTLNFFLIWPLPFINMDIEKTLRLRLTLWTLPCTFSAVVVCRWVLVVEIKIYRMLSFKMMIFSSTFLVVHYIVEEKNSGTSINQMFHFFRSQFLALGT